MEARMQEEGKEKEKADDKKEVEEEEKEGKKIASIISKESIINKEKRINCVNPTFQLLTFFYFYHLLLFNVEFYFQYILYIIYIELHRRTV